MKFNREELLQQRALLQQHLQWIDSKLSQVDEAESRLNLSSSAESSAHSDAEPQRGSPSSLGPPAAPASAETFPDYVPHHQSSAAIARSTKLGCYLSLILATLLFLFILFVLPHWMY